MRAIFKDAAAVGNATARAITFDVRNSEAYLYDNSQWKVGFTGGDYRWLKDGGAGGRNQDARTAFFYFATVITPAKAGSQSPVSTARSNRGSTRPGGPGRLNWWTKLIESEQDAGPNRSPPVGHLRR
jgi:hypothetical protein